MLTHTIFFLAGLFLGGRFRDVLKPLYEKHVAPLVTRLASKFK